MTSYAALLEREQDRLAHEALAGERARIARELHDIVAHSVSVMGVQAGAARLSMDTEPDRARQVLLSIEETAREAVGELAPPARGPASWQPAARVGAAAGPGRPAEPAGAKPGGRRGRDADDRG